MIKKHDLILVGATLVLVLGMILIYDAFIPKPRPIATIDIKSITDEFLSLAVRANLPEEQMNGVVEEFSRSLDAGIADLSKDHIILNKRAVVTQELDLTEDLKEYVFGKIAEKVTK